MSSRKVIEDLIAADASSVYKPTDCISVVTTWEADRDLVKKVLDELKSQAELKVSISSDFWQTNSDLSNFHFRRFWSYWNQTPQRVSSMMTKPSWILFRRI